MSLKKINGWVLECSRLVDGTTVASTPALDFDEQCHAEIGRIGCF